MDCIETYNECQDLLTQFEASNRAEVDGFFQLLEEFSGRYKRLKEKLPYHINVIDELHVNENANSRILASLLQYNENGEYTLLKSFIQNRLGDWEIDVSEPQISSEDWRIDLLVREKGKYAIIFENKIYDAVLQKNQLARYIIKMRIEGFKDEQIYVVFLPPQKYDPTDCSWKVPIKECETCCDATMCPNVEENSLKTKFKDRFKIITFREDIVTWLEEDVIPNCRQKETYLYTAALQYLDYLKGYFDLRTINKNMNMELQDYLINKLELENKTEEQQISILDKKMDEIQHLLNQMNEIKASINNRIAERDWENWNSNLHRIKEEAEIVAKKLELKGEAGFVNPDNHNDSYIFVRFYREDWDLSIIFEKYGSIANHSFFTYIGICGENTVDSKYLNKKQIFRFRSYPNEHPYGWEYDNEYHQKPNDLKRDIENGGFEKYLEAKVRDVLQKIEEYQLPMK